MDVAHEVIVADAGSTDGTREVAEAQGCQVLRQREPGYGGALREAFGRSRGAHVLTMDSDLSHDPYIVRNLYRARDQGDVVIASRYVRGGMAEMPVFRRVLSAVLNRVYGVVLDLPFRDLSSGFRLYDRRVLESLDLGSRDFEILQEILIKAYVEGWRVHELPFPYKPRGAGRSHARLLPFALAYGRNLYRMWRTRNSCIAADYDERAFRSRHPLQRFWHRRRHAIVMAFSRSPHRVLDVGCGSSQITKSLPQAVGLDVRLRKLMFLRETNPRRVNASLERLPFRDGSFDELICTAVVEHVPEEDLSLEEFRRVLGPDGTLILSTPDWDSLAWRCLGPLYRRLVPGAYARQHITRYTARSIRERLRAAGFREEEHRTIAGAELVLRCRRVPWGPARGARRLAGSPEGEP